MPGPDGIEMKRIQGDVFAKQEMIQEAGEVLETADRELLGLDEVFVTQEALVKT